MTAMMMEVFHPLTAYLSFSLFLRLCLVNITAAESQPPTFSPPDLKTFSNGKLYYRYFMIDSTTNSLYVGAMEFVIRLNADNINETGSGVFAMSSNLSSSSAAVSKIMTSNFNLCYSRGKSATFDCRSHARALSISSGSLYVCTTGAYNPQEFSLSLSSLSVTSTGSSGSGLAKCPLDPSDNATFIYVVNGNPGNAAVSYSATYTDFSHTDSLIYRPSLTAAGGDYLRTVERDTIWLDSPQFVAAFEVGSFIYFFLREIAVEYMGPDAMIYSRVARVCKSDQGNPAILSNRWATFTKARLNCSLPGDFPYYFDVLYDVFPEYNVNGEILNFYGVFVSSLSGYVVGSAVCVFNIDDIVTVFNGSFQEQTQSNYIWQMVPSNNVPSPRPGSCLNTTLLPDSVLQFIKSHPLLDGVVPQSSAAPLLYQPDIIFRRLVIDIVSRADGNTYNVLYLATDRGQIYKVVQWYEGSTVKQRRLAILTPFATTTGIWQMKLYNGFIYVGTDDAVAQFSLVQCNQYFVCSQCIVDPHCAWNTQLGSCLPYASGKSLLNNVTSANPIQDCDLGPLNYCRGAPSVINVNLQSLPVQLLCSSACADAQQTAVTWSHDNQPIVVDNVKYLLTSTNALIVLNVTAHDTGSYSCQTTMPSIVLANHYVNVTGCGDDEKCVWKNQFLQWCDNFSQYKLAFNQWACLKNQCLNSTSITIGGSSNTCSLSQNAISQCKAPN